MLSELLFYTLTSGTLFYVLYKWATKNREYFAKRNLKHLKPRFLIGNTTGLFLKRYTPENFIDQLYYSFPKEKYVSIPFGQPVAQLHTKIVSILLHNIIQG